MNVVPNGFPATKVSASRDLGDNSVVEFIQVPFSDSPSHQNSLLTNVQDPEPLRSHDTPSFILKLNNDEELIFKFTFVVRQSQSVSTGTNGTPATPALIDTTINGLTYVSGSTHREVENLVTREFHADPNLHKNANVQLVGDYSTGGSTSVSFEWSWKWKPPKATEDKGGGWRNTCSVCC